VTSATYRSMAVPRQVRAYSGAEFVDLFYDHRLRIRGTCRGSACTVQTQREVGTAARIVGSGESVEYCCSGWEDGGDLLFSALAGITELGDIAVSHHQAPLSLPLPDLTDADRELRADFMLAGQDAAHGVSCLIADVRIQWAETQQIGAICRDDKPLRLFRRGNIMFRIDVSARRAGEEESAWESPGWQEASDVRVENVRHHAATAAQRAVDLLDAKPVEPGSQTVVFGPASGGVLIHEACGHPLEDDNMRSGNPYHSRIGQKIAPENVSVVDWAAVPGGWYRSDIDDEGEDVVATRLIDHGVLCATLRDRKAVLHSAAASCNGRRSGFDQPPIPRMTNTYVEPGSDTPRDILADTGKGLYASRLGGGQVNPVTGNYMFHIAEGYTISRGRLGAMVRGAMVVGNGLETIAAVDAVGNDLAFAPAICSKANQPLPVSVGQPTLRVGRMAVAGA
jgi:TldD protein